MRSIILALAAAALSACSHSIQTTSGEQYLAEYDHMAGYSGAGSVAGSPGNVAMSDAMIREAAAVEPILRFPARLGLARLEGGHLTGIPEREIALWHDLAQSHRNLGEFVPVSPVIAHFTAGVVRANELRRNCAGSSKHCRTFNASDVVSKIRLGAARQHVDAVLIYSIGSTSRQTDSPLAFADFTLIGSAILPTRNLEAHGVAEALLIDVRNGYPYGTVRAEADLSRLSDTWGARGKQEVLREKASFQVVEKLLPEVEQMLGKLRTELVSRPKSGKQDRRTEKRRKKHRS